VPDLLPRPQPFLQFLSLVETYVLLVRIRVQHGSISQDILTVAKMPSDDRKSADISVYGAQQSRSGTVADTPALYSTRTSYQESLRQDSETGEPLPLLRPDGQDSKIGSHHRQEQPYQLQKISSRSTNSHLGDALEALYQTQSTRSHPYAGDGTVAEAGSPATRGVQGIPPELRNITTEIIFVLVCSSGQLLFSFLLGNINVNQQAFRDALGIRNTQLPWLTGSYLVALGLSVILSGSISDLMPPRLVVLAAFAWLTVWNTIGCFALTPARSPLFFFVRAMQGLAVGVLVSGSMSILGRVYWPGQRKTRVFSAMAAMAPFGFWVGALQGGE
jgi:hypothetical protein